MDGLIAKRLRAVVEFSPGCASSENFLRVGGVPSNFIPMDRSFGLLFLACLILLTLPSCIVSEGSGGPEVGLGGIGVADDGLSVDVSPAWGGGAFVDERNYYGGGHHHGGHGRR
jgi:hypothetical protein